MTDNELEGIVSWLQDRPFQPNHYYLIEGLPHNLYDQVISMLKTYVEQKEAQAKSYADSQRGFISKIFPNGLSFLGRQIIEEQEGYVPLTAMVDFFDLLDGADIPHVRQRLIVYNIDFCGPEVDTERTWRTLDLLRASHQNSKISRSELLLARPEANLEFPGGMNHPFGNWPIFHRYEDGAFNPYILPIGMDLD